MENIKAQLLSLQKGQDLTPPELAAMFKITEEELDAWLIGEFVPDHKDLLSGFVQLTKLKDSKSSDATIMVIIDEMLNNIDSLYSLASAINRLVADEDEDASTLAGMLTKEFKALKSTLASLINT